MSPLLRHACWEKVLAITTHGHLFIFLTVITQRVPVIISKSLRDPRARLVLGQAMAGTGRASQMKGSLRELQKTLGPSGPSIRCLGHRQEIKAPAPIEHYSGGQEREASQQRNKQENFRQR